MSRAIEDRNRRMLRARDTMDRAFARPLDVPALARVAYVSSAHFSRQFRATFGETPHRYLQRRRVERAMELLRETERPVTEIYTLSLHDALPISSRTLGPAPQACARSSSAEGTTTGPSGGWVKRSGLPNGSRSAQSIP